VTRINVDSANVPNSKFYKQHPRKIQQELNNFFPQLVRLKINI